MRCPDCNKFVSMENADPEIGSVDCEYSDDSFQVTADIRAVRSCADCSTELKSLDLNLEQSVELSQFDGWKGLSEEQQKLVREQLESGEANVESNPGEGRMEESGGSRYKKNMITIAVDYSIEITVHPEEGDSINLTYNGELSEEHAASEFEECC